MNARQAFGIGCLLMIHHWCIHPELDGVDRLYQISDWANPASHEFWVNLAFVGALLSDTTNL